MIRNLVTSLGVNLVCLAVCVSVGATALAQEPQPPRPRFELPNISIDATSVAELEGDTVVLTYPDYEVEWTTKEFEVAIPLTETVTVEKVVDGQTVQMEETRTKMVTQTQTMTEPVFKAEGLKSERFGLDRVRFYTIDGTALTEPEVRSRLTSKRLVIFWMEGTPAPGEVPVRAPYKHLFRDDVMFLTGTDQPLRLELAELLNPYPDAEMFGAPVVEPYGPYDRGAKPEAPVPADQLPPAPVVDADA